MRPTSAMRAQPAYENKCIIKYQTCVQRSQRAANPLLSLALTLGPSAPFQISDFCKLAEPANHGCASCFGHLVVCTSNATSHVWFLFTCAYCVEAAGHCDFRL